MHSLLLLRLAVPRRTAPRRARAEQSAPETGNFNELLQRFGVAGTIGTLPRPRVYTLHFQVAECAPGRLRAAPWILRGSTCQALMCLNY